MSLYDQHRELFEQYSDKFPALIKLSKLVDNADKMDEALGGSRGVTQHWIAGRHPLGPKSEKRAVMYFIERGDPKKEAVEPPVDQMFIISVPVSAKAKAEMLMGMMRNIGCSIVDF